MTCVKPFRDSEVNVMMLMGIVLRDHGVSFAAADPDGMRLSHTRVLTCIPEDGISITALAERTGMTKQGCGQFVTKLVDSGHVAVAADPDDRRVRHVRRTEVGDRFMASVSDRMARLEKELAEQVGVERYAVFRAVLDDLAAVLVDDAARP